MDQGMQVESNSIDEFFDIGNKSQQEFKRNIEKSSILVHKIFAQNEDGRELVARWKEFLIMTPTVHAQATQFEAGIAEGHKEFIRTIINQIQTCEDSTSGE